jgi:SRSO17 transposase
VAKAETKDMLISRPSSRTLLRATYLKKYCVQLIIKNHNCALTPFKSTIMHQQHIFAFKDVWLFL